MTPQQLEQLFQGKMSGDRIAETVNELDQADDWQLEEVILQGKAVGFHVIYLPTGEAFTITAKR